ncbi:AraC family transcriptional regulator [Mesorhizobium sp. VK9D]|uniref:AraC family transcriptional regulator n=1 Tax=Mesorhizobium australafricanum TaxID=3072311 RepID=UPI002A243F24|nr:AraC family transcriptional regulator [Mesorhizobium sp. VK9D]MDX8456268.1 AraC family transcriptional regulator [Mesorhizobium sp. VK9D]
MRQRGAYGEQLAETFRLGRAPAFVTRSLPKSAFAVTEIDCGFENNGMTVPIPREDAFLVTLQLLDCPAHDLWIDGKARDTSFLAAGTTCIYDLRCSPVVNSVSRFRNLHFYFPRVALDAISEREDLAPIADFHHNPGTGINDPVIRGLGLSLLPAFERPAEATRLFVDHVTIATASYLARTFARNTSAGRQSKWPSLSTLEESLVKELIDSRLGSDLSLAELASECAMSERQFVRAFRERTGVPPHRWLIQRRMHKALDLLATSKEASLADIALACGFMNSSHLARTLARAHGLSVSGWLKAASLHRRSA